MSDKSCENCKYAHATALLDEDKDPCNHCNGNYNLWQPKTSSYDYDKQSTPCEYKSCNDCEHHKSWDINDDSHPCNHCGEGMELYKPKTPCDSVSKIEQGREEGAIDIDIQVKLDQLEKDIATAINKLSLESFFADTPDFILAGYCTQSLCNLAFTMVSKKDEQALKDKE